MKGQTHARLLQRRRVVKYLTTIGLGILLLLGGCLHQNKKTVPGVETPGDESGPDFVSPAVSIITGLAGPESVLYDPEQDVYFISNINGGLLTADNNGFISRVRAATMTVERGWISGGTNGVRLDAPKGMAILGDSLYVSDVSAVRKFDRRSGAPLGEVELRSATLINDLTTDGSSIYVSDTGVKPAAGITFVPTGSDAIWKITGDRATKLADGDDLNHPNGIDYFDGGLWVVTFGANELYRLDEKGKKDVALLPRGQLDGVIHLQDGTPLVSSWIGNAVYRRGKNGFVPVLRGLEAPADIGYDSKRRRLLVPNSPANVVAVHPLPGAP